MQLTDPFPAGDIEWRVQRQGVKNGKPWALVVPYVTARAVAERLDDVFGPMSWQVHYRQLTEPSGAGGGTSRTVGFMSTISVSESPEEWVDKEDGAPLTEIESIKGGISDSFKRAGVVWGIGRYLYKTEQQWAVFSEKGSHSTKIENTFYKWDPPQNALPLPKVMPTHAPAPENRVATPSRPSEGDLQLEGESDTDQEKSYYIEEMKKLVDQLTDEGQQIAWGSAAQRATTQPLAAVKKAKATLARVVMEQER
jgi:hypothetical protein